MYYSFSEGFAARSELRAARSSQVNRQSQLRASLACSIKPQWMAVPQQQTEYTQHYTDLLAYALAKLGNCAAVELQQLDLTDASVPNGDEPGAVATVFQGLQLKQLSIASIHPGQHGHPPLLNFQPLAQHLTQLHLDATHAGGDKPLSFFKECLQPLAQLQPLVLGTLDICAKDILDPEVPAALYFLAEAIKVPVKINELHMCMLSSEQPQLEVITPALLQEQREDLTRLISLLQPLQCCFVGRVEVSYLHEVVAADVLALAPLCRDCSHFELEYGSVEPSLEFWRQLVQLMPAMQKVELAAG
ncbi:hypothetical protein HaLaN_04706 [Haematococcus lacustris]|uniref:Uncharacterized protein n=1 Tax=Haematococcus lacustris TaxID=44745 RepID=A0A699YT63_HAELA|nr:hypothetical protein HaLaN_04706 [Haematococcus lacustris]